MSLDKKIAIIGTGEALIGIHPANFKDVTDKIVEKVEGNVIKKLAERIPERVIEIQPRPLPKLEIPGERSFVCKGKHEYRQQINGSWQCECGRVL